jgi:pimeloyl-ACP methyl ester carboxylesterase
MAKLRRIMCGVVVALVAIGLLVAVPAATTAGAAPSTGTTPVPPPIKWGPCSDQTKLPSFHAQCGLLTVPLDYAHPGGAKVQIAVSRIRHTVPQSQYLGVILGNPGGPGAAGLGQSLESAFTPAGPYYDWIGFDPRGIGDSRPLISCPDANQPITTQSYTPQNLAQLQTWLSTTKAFARSCTTTGPLLAHLGTVDVARDMDSIRVALGASKISYYGLSYGTYLGQVYATLFPQRVFRMILDSNIDPRRVWLDESLDRDLAAQHDLRLWFAWVATNDSVYGLGRTEGAVEAIFNRVEKNLIKKADGMLNANVWLDAFLGLTDQSGNWARFATLLSRYVTVHDDDTVSQIFSSGIRGPNAAFSGVTCLDAPYPTTAAWLAAYAGTYLRAPDTTGSDAWNLSAPCLYWPIAARQPITVNGARVASALLIAQTLDPNTPYSGSVEVRRLFPHASLVATPGGIGHATSLSGDPCVDGYVNDYLLTGTRPIRQPGAGADATCAAPPPPVAVLTP